MILRWIVRIKQFRIFQFFFTLLQWCCGGNFPTKKKRCRRCKVPTEMKKSVGALNLSVTLSYSMLIFTLATIDFYFVLFLFLFQPIALENLRSFWTEWMPLIWARTYTYNFDLKHWSVHLRFTFELEIQFRTVNKWPGTYVSSFIFFRFSLSHTS